MRRIFVSTFGAILLLFASFLPTFAQEATPTSDLESLGLPELDVTVTATSYEGVPATLEAGRYLVKVTATADSSGKEGTGIAFAQPVGMSIDDFLGAVSGPPPAEASGTPMAGMDDAASPEAGEGDEEGGAPPPAFYNFVLAGGVSVMPGGTAEVVLDLTPGDWLAWGDNPGAAQAPEPFTVTGTMPTDLPEPQSSATVTLGEYVIKVTAGEIQAGPQILKIENIGAQPHFIYVGKAPDGTTDEDVSAILNFEMTGTPPATGIDPNTQLEDVLTTATQSRGTTTWLPVDLEPGTYVAMCFFPDLGDGMPHAYHGMHTVFVVAG
jgi:hypothetical protein